MIQKLLIICILMGFFNNEAYSLDYKLKLEESRIKRVEIVIERVNNIYSFINLYILEKGLKPNDISVLSTEYAGLNTEGYNKSDVISFTWGSTPGQENIITFDNVVPSNLSNMPKQIYFNNDRLNPNAIVDTVDLKISINLEVNTTKFLKRIEMLKLLDPSPFSPSANYRYSDFEPTCSASINDGKIWYQPDLDGGFIMSVCLSGSWNTTRVNKLNINIYRDTFTELSNISPPVGTIGYARRVISPFEIREYVFDGVNWQEVEN